MRVRNWILVLPLAVFLIQLEYHRPQLPEKVASHFDAEGNANGWSSREEFLLIMAATVLGSFTVFAVISLVMGKVPVSLINVPRKSYWLAPERRESTIALLRSWLAVFGIATQLLLMAIFEVTVQANLRDPPRIPGAMLWGILGAYLAFTVLWLLLFYLRFGKEGGSAEIEPRERVRT
jgi:uncharacterized membrane protein